MERLSTLGVARDAWLATRGGPEALARRQRERLADLVEFARTRSRFYAEKYAGLPERVTDLTALPPVTKPELMARFDDWVTDPEVTRAKAEAFAADPSRVGEAFLGRYTLCTTSGTTGVPAIILLDERTSTVQFGLTTHPTMGSTLDGRTLRRWLRNGGRVASIFATGGHYLGITSMLRQLREKPALRSRMRPLSALDPLPKIVAGLNEFQPATIGAYPSVLALLADEQEAGRLSISPAILHVAGETLLPAVRERLARVFGAKVADGYSSSETMALAYDCGHGAMHLLADWYIVEPVDAEGRPVPPGVTSASILVTNLANRVQPIIRYQMGDRVTVLPGRCACGSPRPAIRVEGRTDDVLRFRTPAGASGSVLPLALWSVIKETPGVYRFQAIQTGADRLEVRLEEKAGASREAVWAAARGRVWDFLAAQGLAGVEVALSSDAPAPDPRSGKFRAVWADRTRVAAG